MTIARGALILTGWALCSRLAAADSDPAATPAAGANLLPNPSFELVEPPLPTPETAQTGAPADTWLPRTWEVWVSGGAEYRNPDDPARAHSGRRCVSFRASTGQATLRYGAIPVADRQPWTVKAWARGSGKLVLQARDYAKGNVLLQREVFALTGAWAQVGLQVVPTEGCEKWWLDITHEGAAEFAVDDVAVSHPALKPLDLPPTKPLGKDAHTLLYLPCEAMIEEDHEGDVRFLKVDGVDVLGVGHEELSGANQGRFGRSIGLWPGSTMVCSASEHLNPSCGTVEVWVKLRTPRDDGISQHIVGVTGPDGMYFGKGTWGELSLRFSSGWGSLCNVDAGASGATIWQPGVWRHFVACWDKEALQIFVDGKLEAWQTKPHLVRSLGDTLCIGGSNWSVDRGSFDFDDLRISDIVRYRIPLPPPVAPAERK